MVTETNSSYEDPEGTQKLKEAVFAEIGPFGVDALIRQAFLVAWQSMSKEKRSSVAVAQVMKTIFNRNLDAWIQDSETFSK